MGGIAPKLENPLGPEQLGCFATFFAEEDWDELRTFQDASRVLKGYCTEDHETAFCDSLVSLVFSSISESLQSPLQPVTSLCEELESVRSAEQAWLDGQQAALQQRSSIEHDE